MKLGLTMFSTDRAIKPAELAREAEQRGFHSLYVPEHTHIPASRKAMEKAGRDPVSIGVVPFGTVPNERKLEYYASLGITEVVLRLPSAPAEVVLPLLDRYTGLL